jgi:hypothetical protein
VRRGRVIALVGVLLSCATGPIAIAAPPTTATAQPSAGDVAQAYKHLGAGQKLLAQKKYAEARGEFEVSFGLDPQPIALKGIADSLRGEGRLVDAYDAYDRVLVQPGRPLLAYQRKEVDAALADLAQKTATVAIVVNEADASIGIDGVAIGTSPRPAPVRLEIGAHKITITKAGFNPFETTVTLVAAQATTVTANLTTVVKPNNTTEVVVKEKSGRAVDVIVDGLIVGKTPWRGHFAAGAYHVALGDGGASSAPRDLTIAGGEAVPVELELEAPVGAAPEPECKVDDDCDDRELCDKGVCKRRPKKPKWAEEGQSCVELPCVEGKGLVCSEKVCRLKKDLPFALRSGFSGNWRVGFGVAGESQWVAPVHVLTAAFEIPLGRWVRYHVGIGYASINGAHGVYGSPLGFGFPIPVNVLPESTGMKTYIEPGIDAFRAYGAFTSDTNDGMFAYALWGRLVAVRKELFFTFTPLELEQPFYRMTGNSQTGFFFKTSGTNYVVSLGVGVML